MSVTSKKDPGPSTRKFKSICLFGGSSLGKDVAFKQAADELGKTLAALKINLVYGGGIQGLTGFAAGVAAIRGSKVLSIVLKQFAGQFTLGTELRVTSMHERLGYMFENAEAFIAVPGGLGTLEQVSNIISWANLKLHNKPIALLNINGFYDGLLYFLDKAVEQGFIPQASRRAILSSLTVSQLIDQLLNFVPEPLTCQIDGHNKDESLDTTLRL